MPVTLNGTNGLTFPDGTVQNTVGYSPWRNRIINGDMRIDQRNNGASVTPTANAYTLDRWLAQCTQSSKFSVQQNAGSVTPPNGFKNYLGCTSLSAYSVAAGDVFTLTHRIEGYNVADLNWGTSAASAITISFWVRSSLTGTFGGALQNIDGTRNYPLSYSISAANTWEYKTLTIAGDTTGTWNSTNQTGIHVLFSLGAGSTYSGTAGAWTGTNAYSSTGAVSVVGTNGATFYITGVQLEAGSTATPFERVDYSEMLRRCSRYFLQYGKVGDPFAPVSPLGTASSTVDVKAIYQFPVAMRATPTLTQSSLQLTDSASSFAVTAISQSSSEQSPIACNVNFTVASGLTQFKPYWARCANNANGFVSFSAEL